MRSVKREVVFIRPAVDNQIRMMDAVGLAIWNAGVSTVYEAVILTVVWGPR